MKLLKKMKLNEQGKALDPREMKYLVGGDSCTSSGCGSDATLNVNNLMKILRTNNGY